MSFVERRRHERYAVTEEILVVLDGEKTLETGTLVNVGRYGCYVATSAVFEPGDRLTLLLHIPEGPGYSLRLACMVAWHNSGQLRTAREGFGLEFLYVSKTRTNVAKLLDALESRGTLSKLAE
jgi:Tfp pilus assembly protein PilZ